MPATSNIEFLSALESIIVSRLESPVEGSYTSSLIESGPKRMAQKVGEEAVELAIAAVAGNRSDMISESADLIYHLLVLLNSKSICLADVAAVLESRHTKQTQL